MLQVDDDDSGVRTPLLKGAVKTAVTRRTISSTPSTSVLQVVETDFPRPHWTSARKSKDGRQFPQCISHRGYKAAYPENTMSAFRGAVEAGTHALETDVHLTRDNVAVLSHDPTMLRCFGRNVRLVDCDWKDLKDLPTLDEPKSPLPRLRDLLEYLTQPEVRDIWVLLDIKRTNDAEKVIRAIAESLASVPAGARPWKNRILLGIWAPNFLHFAVKYLPGYAVTHIGVSSSYGRQFQRIPNVAMNLNQQLILRPGGGRYWKHIQQAQRPLFLWTINDVSTMKWAVQQRIDGVVTDDPKTFIDVCQAWEDEEPTVIRTWMEWFWTLWFCVALYFRGRTIRREHPDTVEAFLRRNDVRTQAMLATDRM